jgi:hypothetical protein
VQWPSSVNRTSVSLAVEFLRSNQPLSVGSWWKIRTGPVKPCTPSEKFWWHGKSIMIHSELPAKTYFKQQKFGMLSQPPKVRWESCVWKPHQPIKHVNALLSRRCFLELNHSVGCHSSFNPHMSRLQSQLCWLNSPMFQASMQISHHFWCLDLKFFLVPFSPILYIYILVTSAEFSPTWNRNPSERADCVCFEPLLALHGPRILEEWKRTLKNVGTTYHFEAILWKKSCTSWWVVYPIVYKVSTIQGDAGFLPSTVVWEWIPYT